MKFQIFICCAILLAACNPRETVHRWTAPKSHFNPSNAHYAKCRGIQNRFLNSEKVGQTLVFTFQKLDGEELTIHYKWNKQKRLAVREEVGNTWKFTFADLPTTDDASIIYTCEYVISEEKRKTLNVKMQNHVAALTDEILEKYYELKNKCNNYQSCIADIPAHEAVTFQRITQRSINGSKLYFQKELGGESGNYYEFLSEYWKRFGICLDSQFIIAKCGDKEIRWNIVYRNLYMATNRIKKLIENIKGTSTGDGNIQSIQVDGFTELNLPELFESLQKALTNFLAQDTLREQYKDQFENLIKPKCETNSPPHCKHFAAGMKLLKEIDMLIKIGEKVLPPTTTPEEIVLKGYKSSILEPYAPENQVTISTGLVLVRPFGNKEDNLKEKFPDVMIPVMAQFHLSKLLQKGLDLPIWNALSLDIGHGFHIVDTPDPRNNVQIGKNWLLGISLSASGYSISAGIYVFENQENEKINTTLYFGFTFDLQKAGWLLKQFGFTTQIPTLKEP